MKNGLNSLGVVFSYSKWIRWTAKLWLWVMLATVAFLGIAVAITLVFSSAGEQSPNSHG